MTSGRSLNLSEPYFPTWGKVIRAPKSAVRVKGDNGGRFWHNSRCPSWLRPTWMGVAAPGSRAPSLRPPLNNNDSAVCSPNTASPTRQLPCAISTLLQREDVKFTFNNLWKWMLVSSPPFFFFFFKRSPNFWHLTQSMSNLPDGWVVPPLSELGLLGRPRRKESFLKHFNCKWSSLV